MTRYYDGHFEYEYDTEMPDDLLDPNELVIALDSLAKDARRLDAPTEEQEEATQALRTKLANWADRKKEAGRKLKDLRTKQGVALLRRLRRESNMYSQTVSADLIELFQGAVDDLLDMARMTPIRQQLEEAIGSELPVFIYFENYGILDSAVYLPRFLEDLSTEPEVPRVRTINAMFKHVQLTAQEISDLGKEEAESAKIAERQVTLDIIARGQRRKELRSVKLNSASVDISTKFSQWFGQRRHKIRYQADGRYFRIWVSDDRRPDVDIELESRSKGFQWFFSFYLVFLVESEEGHKDSILLLDEPGVNGGGIMRQSGGVRMYHWHGGSLSP